MQISLDELAAFVAVVDTRSITAAAEQLDQTSSGVSRALGRLERKLGTTLLTRTTRRLALTEEGAAFLVHARRILQSVDDAEDDMAMRRQQPAGRLRVNAASPFMLHAVVPLVPEFSRLYPRIELELDTSDHIIDLLEQRTDVAIRIGPLQDSTLHARALTATRLRVLASPAYLKAAGTPRSAAEVHEHAVLGFNQPESLNTWPLRDRDGNPVVVRPRIAASSGETLRHLALQGLGLVCLADFMTGADRARGGLVEVLADETLDVRQPVHAVYYRNTQLAARIACFVDFLSARLARAG